MSPCSTFPPLSPLCSYSPSPGQSENEVFSVQFLSHVHAVKKERKKETDGERERRDTGSCMKDRQAANQRPADKWMQEKTEFQVIYLFCFFQPSPFSLWELRGWLSDSSPAFLFSFAADLV